MHTGLGSCCAECAQKASTLGMLGWLPSGFGFVNVDALVKRSGDADMQYIAPPPLPAQQVVSSPSAGEYRAGALIGLAIGGVLSYGGYSLWKNKHQVWGGLLLVLGMPGVVSGSYQLATGEPLFGRR